MIVVQELLNKIQILGYRFELIGDSVKFTYTRGGQTPKEAIPILKQFKERKQEVIEYLQAKPELQKSTTKDQFTEVFDSAADEINRQYIPGVIQYASKTFPEIYQKGIESENRINRLWNEGSDLNTFKLAVNEWRNIELELIRMFKNKQS